MRCQLLRTTRGDQPIRHRILGVVEGDLDRSLHAGLQHQVSPGIGVHAGALTRLLSRQRKTRI